MRTDSLEILLSFVIRYRLLEISLSFVIRYSLLEILLSFVIRLLFVCVVMRNCCICNRLCRLNDEVCGWYSFYVAWEKIGISKPTAVFTANTNMRSNVALDATPFWVS